MVLPMALPMTEKELQRIVNLNSDERLAYSFKEFSSTQKIWILTDEHGCMMLNTDDEDCIPVWPTAAFAQKWAVDEWKNCKAESINLTRWFSHWSQGLSDDEIAIVVFPNEQEEGVVFYPDEFEHQLKKTKS